MVTESFAQMVQRAVELAAELFLGGIGPEVEADLRFGGWRLRQEVEAEFSGLGIGQSVEASVRAPTITRVVPRA